MSERPTDWRIRYFDPTKESKSQTAALWAIATALGVIAGILALLVMMNASG